MLYFDYSATTPVLDELLDMYEFVCKNYIGNVNSNHELGKKSLRLLEDCTSSIAEVFNCYDKEIVFTSGASEANAMAIMGTVESLKVKGKHIITSKLEHKSILDLMKHLESLGYIVEYVNVLSNGLIDLEDLENKIRDDTILISICGVNSEVGYIQPLDKIRDIIDKNDNKIFFHSDLTQALGKIKIDLSCLDLASFSSHKIYAPIGCGILYKKRTIQIGKLIYGSTCNSLYRGGTPALPLIVTFARGIEIASSNFTDNYNKCLELKKMLVDGLLKYPIKINSNNLCVPQIVNFSLLEYSNKLVISKFSENGVYLSTTTACGGNMDESITLKEVTNGDVKISKTSLRVSISHMTTEEEVYKFLDIFDKIWNEINDNNLEKE